MKNHEELEAMRHGVTPAEFCAYVRRMIKTHKITAICAEDITVDYLASDYSAYDFNYHDIPGKPCKAERSIEKPYEKQTYIRGWEGNVFNQIIEFTFDDEKTGTGYFYMLNDYDDDRTAEHQTANAETTEPEPATVPDPEPEEAQDDTDTEPETLPTPKPGDVLFHVGHPAFPAEAVTVTRIDQYNDSRHNAVMIEYRDSAGKIRTDMITSFCTTCPAAFSVW